MNFWFAIFRAKNEKEIGCIVQCSPTDHFRSITFKTAICHAINNLRKWCTEFAYCKCIPHTSVIGVTEHRTPSIIVVPFWIGIYMMKVLIVKHWNGRRVYKYILPTELWPILFRSGICGSANVHKMLSCWFFLLFRTHFILCSSSTERTFIDAAYHLYSFKRHAVICGIEVSIQALLNAISY